MQWAEALVDAGAGPVNVVQRFPRNHTLRRAGVGYHFVADQSSFSFMRWAWGERAAETVRALRPTVVHVDGMIFPLLVRHLRVRLPREIPILVQDHGGLHEGSPGFRRWSWSALHRLGLAAADGFLFTTRELTAPWVRAGIIDGRQTIYEVLESSTTLADETVRSADKSSDAPRGLPGRPALLWVGRLDGNKDPLTVLDAFERVLPALPEAALSMVFTEDPLLPEVRRRIAAPSPLAGRVHLLGRRERSDLPSLYRSADLFVLASHHESCGFALLEALSFGVTPLVSDIPSFRTITDGGRLGALFPIGDAGVLARQLERLGSTELAPLRKGVRDHFARELSWSAVGPRALAAYRSAAAAAAHRA